MGRTPEGKVKDKVAEALREHDAEYFFPIAGPYGKRGVSDIIACLGPSGLFVAIEVKAGKKKATALQMLFLRGVAACGGAAMVVNEHGTLFLQGDSVECYIEHGDRSITASVSDILADRCDC